jgi:hypothetical protein
MPVVAAASPMVQPRRLAVKSPSSPAPAAVKPKSVVKPTPERKFDQVAKAPPKTKPSASAAPAEAAAPHLSRSRRLNYQQEMAAQLAAARQTHHSEPTTAASTTVASSQPPSLPRVKRGAHGGVAKRTPPPPPPSGHASGASQVADASSSSRAESRQQSAASTASGGDTGATTMVRDLDVVNVLATVDSHSLSPPHRREHVTAAAVAAVGSPAIGMPMRRRPLQVDVGQSLPVAASSPPSFTDALKPAAVAKAAAVVFSSPNSSPGGGDVVVSPSSTCITPTGMGMQSFPSWPQQSLMEGSSARVAVPRAVECVGVVTSATHPHRRMHNKKPTAEAAAAAAAR